MALSSRSLRLLQFLLLLIASSSGAVLCSISDEVVALMTMKSLLQDPHGVLRSWDWDAVDHCSFAFVTCSAQNLVARLEAPSQNLSGRLAPSIGNLTNLESLLLQDNNITGTIPAEIGKLGRLKELELSSNHFYGEIPSSVVHLENLRYLDLSFNNLSGPIPRLFSGTLYVGGNPLICGENTTGQECSRTAPAPTSHNIKISQASLPTAKIKSHKFAVAFGSTVACILLLFFPIS